DGTVRLWDVERCEPRATLRGHTGGIWGVALSRDGSVVASGGGDRAIPTWDAARGQLVGTLVGHAGGVRAVALRGEGGLLGVARFAPCTAHASYGHRDTAEAARTIPRVHCAAQGRAGNNVYGRAARIVPRVGTPPPRPNRADPASTS